MHRTILVQQVLSFFPRNHFARGEKYICDGLGLNPESLTLQATTSTTQPRASPQLLSSVFTGSFFLFLGGLFSFSLISYFFHRVRSTENSFESQINNSDSYHTGALARPPPPIDVVVVIIVVVVVVVVVVVNVVV